MQARIMVEEDDYVVLNKPPGVQVTPTVDNMLESCLMLGAKVLAALLHRLSVMLCHYAQLLAIINISSSIHGLCFTLRAGHWSRGTLAHYTPA